MSSSHYIHGTSPEEQQRLTAMNHLLNERFLAQAALAPGERIVDFGAGLGQFSRAMAKVTGVPVVGIERSNEQILEAMRQADADGEAHLIDMRQGNAEIAPLTDGEWGAFRLGACPVSTRARLQSAVHRANHGSRCAPGRTDHPGGR